MKKGFTLVELLAVIVILSVILLIGTTSVSRVVKKNKQTAYDIQMANYIDDVKIWATDNAASLPADNASQAITLGTLISGGYANNTKNPLTDSDFSESLTFCIYNKNGNYTYVVSETSSC